MNVQPLPTAAATFGSRLLHTPLFDLVRGRLTGSLDLRRVIAAAGLPQPVNDLIRRVARRTRLWRIERVDVARELAEHFRDGLAAGRTAEELIESFGDPRQAARLIRRAKLRSRPLFWRVWRRVWRAGVQALGTVAALMIASYLFFAVRLFRLASDGCAQLSARTHCADAKCARGRSCVALLSRGAAAHNTGATGRRRGQPVTRRAN